MKILMHRSVAVRGGVFNIGQEVEATDIVARSLLAAGHASPVDEARAPEAEPAGDDLDSMTLVQLREAAKAEGLATSGSKATLIERLRGE